MIRYSDAKTVKMLQLSTNIYLGRCYKIYITYCRGLFLVHM